MPTKNFIFQTGESCLNTGLYSVVSCSGFYCIGGEERAITLKHGDEFPKCPGCGRNAVWKAVSSGHSHSHTDSHPHTRHTRHVR